MASADWTKKYKSAGEVKAIMRHNDTKERLEHEHANKDIDLSVTPNNFSYRGLSYREKCSRYDQLTEEALLYTRRSSGKNANVTMQSILIYAPAALQEDQLKAWFMRVGDILDEMYGDRFIDMDVHLDEIHDYVVPETRETVTSRTHGHAMTSPLVDGRLSCKKFATRRNINRLNDAIQAMSMQEFGLQWNDGTKKKRRRTVEQMKAASEQAAIDQGMDQIAQDLAEGMEQVRVDQVLNQWEAAEQEAEIRLQEKVLQEKEWMLRMQQDTTRKKADFNDERAQKLQNWSERLKGEEQTLQGLGERLRAEEQALQSRGERLKREAQSLWNLGETMHAEEEDLREQRQTLNRLIETMGTVDGRQAMAERFLRNTRPGPDGRNGYDQYRGWVQKQMRNATPGKKQPKGEDYTRRILRAQTEIDRIAAAGIHDRERE